MTLIAYTMYTYPYSCTHCSGIYDTTCITLIGPNRRDESKADLFVLFLCISWGHRLPSKFRSIQCFSQRSLFSKNPQSLYWIGRVTRGLTIVRTSDNLVNIVCINI